MIGAYARDDITWVQAGGTDEYGEPLAPTEVSLNARVQWGERRVVSWQGEDVLAAATVLMPRSPKPGKDRISINGTEHLVIATHEMKAFGRVAAYKVSIQ